MFLRIDGKLIPFDQATPAQVDRIVPGYSYRLNRFERLFIDKYGQDLRIVGRGRWGQKP